MATSKKFVTNNHEEETFLVTKEGLKALQEELDNLKNIRRKEVAVRLKEAISYGDLSENSEYEEAKNEQAFVEGRILELEDKIKHAKVVDEKQHSKKIIEIGTRVKLRNTKKKSEEYDITIVGATESDALSGRVSNESPLGMALLGAKAGEKVKVNAPAGVSEFEVLKLS
ncbi:transcription elongation factor GreA [Patescibacteria group bacterium]|nr:transcription elongation factor GreA [Patescibacteria group bacterium]